MGGLFQASSAADTTYTSLACGTHQHQIEGRAFSESLWERTSQYLDTDLPLKATLHFHQCFWEMYLAGSLLEAGLPLVPRARRTRPNFGPDLQIEPNIWVEAIAGTAGRGTDAVTEAELGVARDVPDEQMKLRLISMFVEKRRKFDEYRKKGLVGQGDVCVVAINGGLVPSIRAEVTPPRIVRALMEIGHPTIRLSRTTGEVVDRSYKHQPVVTKKSGSTVGQGMFLDHSSVGVSACLYSSSDPVNYPAVCGSDFIVVHNPTATVQLSRAFFRRGWEFWLEDAQILGLNRSL